MIDRSSRLIDELIRQYEDLARDRSRVADRLFVVVDHWRDEWFAGTPIGDDAELWRLVIDAMQDLKTRIARHL